MEIKDKLKEVTVLLVLRGHIVENGRSSKLESGFLLLRKVELELFALESHSIVGLEFCSEISKHLDISFVNCQEDGVHLVKV